jgi:hypothetical protein
MSSQPPICSYAGCGELAVLVWLRFHDDTNTVMDNVFSCESHQINIGIAPLTHMSTCTAPDSAVPNCNCAPISTAVAL